MGNFMPGPVANMGGYTEPRYVVIRSPRGNFMPHKAGASPAQSSRRTTTILYTSSAAVVVLDKNDEDIRRLLADIFA